MVYTLDPWQTITAFNFKSLKVDYAVLYSRIDPPYAVLAGYAGFVEPVLTQVEGNVAIHSVGDFSFPVTPGGTGNRSYPEGGNGSADPLPILLPTFEQIQAVALWHIGRPHVWGLNEQLIMNLKKMKEDYPELEGFEVNLPGHTWAPHVDGDGAPVPKLDGHDDFDPNEQPLRHIIGFRAFSGDGGEFKFEEVDVTDPYGNTRTFTDSIVNYSGGEVEYTGGFEQFGAVPLTIKGNTNLGELRGTTWSIPIKNPRSAVMANNLIGVEE